MGTFIGKLLRIDLTNRAYSKVEIPSDLYRDFISARGLSSAFLYKELAPGVDPLGPENKLIMSIGVLGGTGLQGFSKWAVASKSPLTGTIFRSISGGNFGPWMKYAGYDLMILEGKASEPLYVYVDPEGVQFLDASEIMGRDPLSTQELLKKKHGQHTEAACIGIAGERLVRYATVTSGQRTASRGGMGTVMGAKNLKAVAINTPVKKPAAFDKDKFQSLINKQIEILKAHPRRKNMTTLGTPYITTVVDALGILPVRNFQEGSMQQIEAISGDQFYELKLNKAGCHMCMTRCGGIRKVSQGPLAGSSIDGPEYETIYAFGPLLGILDRQFIIDANALCDFYGIDTISTGVCIAYLFELYEKGFLSSYELDGLSLEWGNRQTVFRLIEKIGKMEGIGKMLGEGIKRMSRHFSPEASSFAMHIKGLELPGYDPRGVKGYALSMGTSNIGGSHMYGRPREELSGKMDPLTETNKGASIARIQKEQALEDSLIACTFGNSGLDLEMYGQLLSAATGLESFESPEGLLQIGERILCIERCFNVREGFRRKDDSLPSRIVSEPLRNAGPCTGEIVKNFDGLLDEYYEALGYNKDGLPSAKKIADLGISYLAGDIPGVS